jgi:hypothetical protein
MLRCGSVNVLIWYAVALSPAEATCSSGAGWGRDW